MFVALQMPRLFTPTLISRVQNILSDLHELGEWSWAARGEQLLHLPHTSYATEFHASAAVTTMSVLHLILAFKLI